MVHNPRTHIVFDDARHYLLTTKEKFDIIASDPLDVFVKGTAALYSKEYFEAVKQHLNPGGMFTLYVPLYETDEPTSRANWPRSSKLSQRHHLGEHARRPGLRHGFHGPGGAAETSISTRCSSAWNAPDYRAGAGIAARIGVKSARSVVDLRRQTHRTWGPGGGRGDQSRPRSAAEYLAGWGINSSLEDALIRRIMSYRTPPSNLMTGSAENLQSLIVALRETR